jgi:O-antigen ligase
MIRKISKKPIIALFFFLWISLICTINVYPEYLFNIKTFLDFVNTLRIWVPIFFGIILLSLLIVVFKKKQKFLINYTHYLSIFFFIFTLQLIGSFLSERLNFQTTYVLIFCFITLLMFALIEHLQLQKIYKYFLYILIFFIALAILLFFYTSFKKIITSIKFGNLYEIFNSYNYIFNQAPPRITGFSRMLAILSLFAIFLIEHHVKKNKKIFIIMNIFLGTIIWMCQSRGTILSYFLSICTIVFILNFQNNFLNKIKKIFIYIFIPIITTYIITIFSTELSTDNIKNKSIDIVQDKVVQHRFITNDSGSSGRFTLWKDSIIKYDKSKLFGYGAQADRVILMKFKIEDIFSNNVSNGLIYTFLSGGYIAFILFVFLYIKILFLVLNFLRTINGNKKVDIASKFSFILIIYFAVRSLYENSFAIWGLDFLLVLISMAKLNQFLISKSKHENINNNNLFK